VKWALPMDWQIGKLQFPVPEHLVEDGFENYVYYDKLVLYAEIASLVTPRPNDVVSAAIQWMVCKDICVPGRQTIERPIEMTNVQYDWPKLPLIPTLQQCNYSWRVLTDSGSTGPHQVTHRLVVWNDKREEQPITDFFPLIPPDLPAKVQVLPNGMFINETTNGKTSVIDSFNGLIFLVRKVYWLKQL
jgi:hypothetical protein